MTSLHFLKIAVGYTFIWNLLLLGGEKSKSKPVVRSISSGDSRTGVLPKLKRQSSSDGSGKLAEDYDDPIMV